MFQVSLARLDNMLYAVRAPKNVVRAHDIEIPFYGAIIILRLKKRRDDYVVSETSNVNIE